MGGEGLSIRRGGAELTHFNDVLEKSLPDFC